MGKRLEITQDVFVKVKKLEDVEQLKEPLCPAPDVRLHLASLPPEPPPVILVSHRSLLFISRNFFPSSALFESDQRLWY